MALRTYASVAAKPRVTLSVDIIRHIVTFASIQTLRKLAQTSSDMREIVFHELRKRHQLKFDNEEPPHTYRTCLMNLSFDDLVKFFFASRKQLLLIVVDRARRRFDRISNVLSDDDTVMKRYAMSSLCQNPPVIIWRNRWIPVFARLYTAHPSQIFEVLRCRVPDAFFDQSDPESIQYDPFVDDTSDSDSEYDYGDDDI